MLGAYYVEHVDKATGAKTVDDGERTPGARGVRRRLGRSRRCLQVGHAVPLDGSGYLKGKYATLTFEQVNAYWGVTEAQKYIQSLGFSRPRRPCRRRSGPSTGRRTSCRP